MEDQWGHGYGALAPTFCPILGPGIHEIGTGWEMGDYREGVLRSDICWDRDMSVWSQFSRKDSWETSMIHDLS